MDCMYITEPETVHVYKKAISVAQLQPASQPNTERYTYVSNVCIYTYMNMVCVSIREPDF